ncbi:MAG: excinuclease ABC subunit UvrC [Burkholderiales bacterium]|nr:excinuclease ABC subunit UvrC [Burkholderiales bacterium]
MEILVSDRDFVKAIPKLPGIYRFYTASDASNIHGELLYIGKAVNLQNRIKSYFQKTENLSPRIQLMVSKIFRIEITVTYNEASALILENNLIKHLKPKYNIIFRDDKSYPLIRLSQHDFPKLDSFRGKVDNDTHTYFGPYPNSYGVRQNLDLISKIFKLRNCSDVVFAARTRPCIMYEIKRCSAPCVNLITKKDYAASVALAVDFLNGKYSTIIEKLTQEMLQHAENMEFEKASVIRDQLNLIKHISSSQIINSYQQPLSADIIICEGYGEKVFIYLIILRNGLYIGDKHFILNNPDNSISKVVEVFLESYYSDSRNTQSVFTQYELTDKFKQLFFQALNIKISNGRYKQVEQLYKMGQINLGKIINQYQDGIELKQIAAELASILNLANIRRIECIDVSHNHGENTVGSIVVYEDGIIDHNKYRRYNLNVDSSGSLIRGNDLLAMKTILQRRLNNHELHLPDVILIDGGSLQLNILKNILDDYELCDRIRGLAIFKGERRNPKLDQIIIDDGKTLKYSENNQLFKLLHLLRDEAHRFAITGHRKKQVKKMSYSELDEIQNLGAKKKKALLAHFGSVKSIANASVSDLQKVVGIGNVLAQQIYAYFH